MGRQSGEIPAGTCDVRSVGDERIDHSRYADAPQRACDIQRRSALVRKHLFGGRNNSTYSISETGFGFPYAVRLSKYYVHRGRTDRRKGKRKTMDGICKGTDLYA